MGKVHILNGDSLKSQLQHNVKGQVIVARECLIDGDVKGENLPDFYRNRANYIAGYDGFTVDDYYQKTVPELNKIKNLSAGCEVTCWFEDDLFCQANFWFVINLLFKHDNLGGIFLVRPNKGNEYSFAHMTMQELAKAYDNRQLLQASEITTLAQLWPLYQQQDLNGMSRVAQKLKASMPFLQPAIEAQKKRMPDDSGLGYPERVLIEIMKELNTQEFSPVFREFSSRMAIYSFGDLQVKRMFEQLNS